LKPVQTGEVWSVFFLKFFLTPKENVAGKTSGRSSYAEENLGASSMPRNCDEQRHAGESCLSFLRQSNLEQGDRPAVDSALGEGLEFGSESRRGRLKIGCGYQPFLRNLPCSDDNPNAEGPVAQTPERGRPRPQQRGIFCFERISNAF
jgi:hypothetical protein